jgi:lysophospholipase L1-like esterase
MYGIQRIWKSLGACALLSAALPSMAQTAVAAADAGWDGGRSWVATWAAAPIAPGPTTIDTLFKNPDRSRGFENQTIRHIVHTSVGGRRVRVRLSNAFGVEPLRVGAAQVALSSYDAAVYPGGRRLTFSGQAGILVPAGAVAVSDAVDFDVPGDGNLAVSVYLPGITEPATYHEITMQNSYVAASNSGNLVSATDLPGAAVTPSTFYLSVVEVLPYESIGTLVALGDSITQGAGSTQNQNRTWPERLSDRLNQGRARLSVINQGIGCNRLLFDFCGPGAAARFDRDVLAVTGVKSVIVHLGLNDIMIPALLPLFGRPEFAAETVSANEMITGLHQLTLRARARGIRIYGATLTPFCSSTITGLCTPENEAKRQAVNRWIRTGGAFDGVIDFEAAVRDPSNPSRTQAIYDADGVHLNDAGYAAMANAINLSMLF